MREEVQEKLIERILSEIALGENLNVGTKERSSNAQDVAKLVEALNTGDRDNVDGWDKEQRREIERERNKSNAEIETAKQDINWKKLALEIAKIGVPLVTAIMYVSLYRESRDIAGHMEETGRYTTTIGRETALPRIFRW